MLKEADLYHNHIPSHTYQSALSHSTEAQFTRAQTQCNLQSVRSNIMFVACHALSWMRYFEVSLRLLFYRRCIYSKSIAGVLLASTLLTNNSQLTSTFVAKPFCEHVLEQSEQPKYRLRCLKNHVFNLFARFLVN